MFRDGEHPRSRGAAPTGPPLRESPWNPRAGYYEGPRHRSARTRGSRLRQALARIAVGLSAESASKRRIRRKIEESVVESVVVARLDDQAVLRPTAPALPLFRPGSRDDREAGGHRLEDHVPGALEIGGQNESVGGEVGGAHVRKRPAEIDHGAQFERLGRDSPDPPEGPDPTRDAVTSIGSVRRRGGPSLRGTDRIVSEERAGRPRAGGFRRARRVREEE